MTSIDHAHDPHDGRSGTFDGLTSSRRRPAVLALACPTNPLRGQA
jgi:hypothetical protein